MRRRRRFRQFLWHGVPTLLAAALLALPARAVDIESQRALFESVYPEVARGNWQAFENLDAADKDGLRAYLLWPDLRGAWLHANVASADHAEIEAFLERYGTLRPARELRYRYALHLADTDQLAAFLEIYRQFYQGLEIAKLDCHALRAEIDAGRKHRVVNRARNLWTVGRSQVAECDPVFAFLNDQNLLRARDYRRRYELAIEAREFAMARWLGKSIDQQHIATAARWIRASKDPEAFVRQQSKWPKDAATAAQLVYAIEHIAYRDPSLALELWEGIAGRKRFSAEQVQRTSRHIALWLARNRSPGAYYQLARLPAAAQSAEVLRWRARTSLRERDWDNLLLDIGLMSAEERDREEWRYWHGIALDRTHRKAEAAQVLIELAGERSYYGFLAADEIGLAYALKNMPVTADEPVIAALAARPDLIRARELYLVGLDGPGRSEWEAVIDFLEPAEKVQAAILAQRWGWHSRAIATVASVREYDDLALRYPLPFRQIFSQYSAAARIPMTWAFGVARSESLFMRDVRSRAGAIGLMQLMPTTGRSVARQFQLPYAGLDTLTNPDSNIRLGTIYLRQMVERFGGNRVLATAAYNAGPQRVAAWLPEAGTIDARVWIENIPFNETRSYVRRVLEAETIFHWRLTGELRRLSEQLPAVRAGGRQLARN